MSKTSLSAFSFINELTKIAPENSQAIYTQFTESPDDANAPRWRWKGSPVNPDSFKRVRRVEANAYITVSSFSGEKRRKTDFVAGLAVMVDDPGTKVDLDKLKMEPTIWLETSPDNFQAWYLLSAPVTDRLYFESVINGFIASGLTNDGKDPGMAGVTRYGRVPGGYNNKSHLLEPWVVQARWGKGKRRYTLEELCDGFGVMPVAASHTGDRIQDYDASAQDTLTTVFLDKLGRFIYDRGMITDVENGAAHIECPWIDTHTGGVNDGSALLVNKDGSIGFKCHHGHCQDKGLKDVWAWAKEEGYAPEPFDAKAEGAGEGGDDWEVPAQPSEPDIWEEVRKAIASDNPEKALLDLRIEYAYASREIDRAVALVEKENLEKENREDVVNRFTYEYPKRLDLDVLLTGDGGELAKAINRIAAAMPTAPEYIFTPLIPVLASQMGTNHRLCVRESAGHYERAIFWSMVVGETGDKKSPALKVATEPLVRLDSEAKRTYEGALTDHTNREKLAKNDDNLDEGEEPIEKRYLLVDATTAVRAAIHEENPVGFLFAKDEASGFISEMARFSGSKDNGEIEIMLSEFNGGAMLIDRKGAGGKRERLSVSSTAVQRTGTTQWGTLAGLMGDHNDDRGLWARFLFCAVKAPEPLIANIRLLDGQPIAPMLYDLVQRIERVPAGEYCYSAKAQKAVDTYSDTLARAGLVAVEDGERGAYPKFGTYLHRFALFFHLLNAVLSRLPVAPTEIEVKSVQQARHALRFFIGQFQLVMNRNSPGRAKVGDGVVLLNLLTAKGPRTLREVVKSSCLQRRGITRTADYRDRLSVLVDAGKVELKGDRYSAVD